MIKITHIQKQDELDVAFQISSYLKKHYSFYFEIKVMGNGANKPPTFKTTARDKDDSGAKK